MRPALFVLELDLLDIELVQHLSAPRTGDFVPFSYVEPCVVVDVTQETKHTPTGVKVLSHLIVKYDSHLVIFLSVIGCSPIIARCNSEASVMP